MTVRALRKILEPLFAILLLGLAILALRHLLKQYSWADIVNSIAHLTAEQLTLAAVLTCFGYLTLTFYDVLALCHLGKHIAYGRVFVAALCAFTAGHNFGFTPLTSLPIRYKFYEPVGLNAVDVSELFLFTSLTFAIGFTVVGGLTLSFLPLPVPKVIHLPLHTLHPLGWILLAVLVIYLVACARIRRTLHIRGRAFHLPTWRIALLQVLLSSIDWCIAGGVLYCLLPHRMHLPYIQFMGVYSLATICGSSSHVPGGLGVFETIMLVMLSGLAPGSAILGTLLAYRLVFSIAPLLVSGVFLLIFLMVRHHGRRASLAPEPIRQ